MTVVGRTRSSERELRTRAAVTAAAVVVIAGGVVIDRLGGAPWALAISVLAILTLAIGQFTRWLFSFAVSLLLLIALAALASRVSPITGLPFEVSVDVVLVGVGLVAATVIARHSRIRAPARRNIPGVIAISAWTIVSAVMLAGSAISGRLGLSWVMHNDAVWNMVTARWIVGDGGILSDSDPNASPLAPLAIAIALSRGLGDDGSLGHDVSRAGQILILATFAASLLAAAIGWATSRGSKRRRAIGAIAAGIVPLTWFTLGFALDFGFYNAIFALPILLACWLCWITTEGRPGLAAAGAALATIAMLATWGPLAVIPAALLGAAALTAIRRRTHRGRALLAVAGAFATVVSYAVLVTLPDILNQPTALSSDGGIFPIQPAGVLIMAVAILGIAVVEALVLRRAHGAVGIGVVALGGLLGLGYLVAQRAGSVDLWGYYPMKFSWLVLSLLLVIAVASVCAIAARLPLRFGIPALLGGGILVAAVTWQAGPNYMARSLDVFPIAAISKGLSGVAQLDLAASQLFRISEASDGGTVIASRLVSAEYDRFMNFWSMQLPAASASDPARKWAYYLDPEDDGQVCDAISDAQPPVVLVTSDDELAGRLASGCDDAEFRVLIVEP